MSVFRRILVPTDFSPNAREAFRVAHDLASPTGSSLVMFHVSQVPAPVPDRDRLPIAPALSAANDARDELRKAQAKAPAVRTEHVTVNADRPVAKHILRIVEERGCDAIVMATHVQPGNKRRLFGKVTEEVVRRAHCPVVVVTAPARESADYAHQTADQPAMRARA
jgi:nucleotide-binding universal stress UspA family protein